MITYKKFYSDPLAKIISEDHILRSDGAIIPFDEGNRDYQIYQQWLLEGNTPAKADE